MTNIDPNLLFFGNWVDTSSRIEDIEKFLGKIRVIFQYRDGFSHWKKYSDPNTRQ